MLISDRWLRPSGTTEECKSLIYVENLFKIVCSLETTKTTDLLILGVHDGAKAPLINSTSKKWKRFCRWNCWHEQFFSFHSCEIFLRKKIPWTECNIPHRQILTGSGSCCRKILYQHLPQSLVWGRASLKERQSWTFWLQGCAAQRHTWRMMGHYCCFCHQTSNLILIQSAAMGWSSCQLPQHLEVPGASPGEGSGGKAGLCTCAAGEEGGGDGDPLESLQNGSSREVNPHESSFISPAAHGGMLLVQASSSEQLKRQETTNSRMGIVNKTQNLQSMITLWWWPAWWIPLDLGGAWPGCYFALGIWNVIWMWWCSENKATLPLWQNKHLSTIFSYFSIIKY